MAELLSLGPEGGGGGHLAPLRRLCSSALFPVCKMGTFITVLCRCLWELLLLGQALSWEETPPPPTPTGTQPITSCRVHGAPPAWSPDCQALGAEGQEEGALCRGCPWETRGSREGGSGRWGGCLPPSHAPMPSGTACLSVCLCGCLPP